ncbi:hypothetical protein [Ralstonia solanacearum]|uniref:hypothetical protein n=1 Tax=Ralstonia solanacearum TaxID=305 RepID=UPI0010729EA9|nr:hypothetical protein [Ralstonia solanacearum]
MSLNSVNGSYIGGSYSSDLMFLLKVAENNKLRINPNSSSALAVTTDSSAQHRAVIGYGYDLVANRKTAVADLTSAGVVLTPSQKQAINSLTSSTSGIPAGLVSLTLPSETVATALLQLAVTKRVPQFDAFLASNNISLPDSRERAALLSMWYQSPKYFKNSDGTLTSLSKALASGNRAEVWYQMRYDSAADGAQGSGILTRRYSESTYFGLYDTGPVTLQEALQVYQVFTLNRTAMLAYDSKHAAQLQATSDQSGYSMLTPKLNDPLGLGNAKDFLLSYLESKYGVLNGVALGGLLRLMYI